VLPSISENFGNVVLEALAAGTPVVVTPEVGLAADVEAAGAGIVTPSDPPRLAAALRELLRDPARREEMGRRGRALVEERFTWPRVAEEMEAAYRGVIGG
jgi:glycosyltransferase involved in cell wall biosynthesis